MDSERPSDPYVDDEIDLRRYVAILFRRWRLIITLAALVVMAAGLVALTSAPPYEAVAGVAIIKSRTELVFDPKFKTVTGDTGATLATSSDAQRNALLGLVQNGAIASQVITQLGSQLESGERNPAALMDMVKGEILQKGDLILIRVRDKSPTKAAAIANAWAQEYERNINSIYSDAPIEYSASVDAELKRAKLEYDKAQADLEVFIAKNKVDELNRLIAEKQYIIGALQKGKQTAVSTVVDEELKARTQIIAAYLSAQATDKLLAFQKEQEGKRGLVTAQMDAQNNARLAVFNQQAQANLQTLANYYDTRLRTGRLLNDARNMREQVRTGGDAAATSNGLALMLLKSQAFALSAGLPGQLQVQVGSPGAQLAAAQTADLNALIAALEKRDAELATAIADLSRQLLSGEGYAFLAATGTVTPTTAISDVLSLAIAGNYSQLFSLGGQAQLTEAVPTDNPLAASATDKSKLLLQLRGLETLPDYSTAAEPVSKSVDKLQQEISAMQAQLEQQQSTKLQLTQARDLTWSTYTTLASKQTEVAIAAGITGSVVRFASPAVPPLSRVSSRTTPVLIAGLVGLLLGVMAAYVVEFLLAGGPPPQALAGNPSAPWNRLWRWVLA